MTNNLAQAPAPQAPAPKSNAGKGLGIAALIIAIVALLLCWVPIINNFAAFLGLVSLVLGVVSLVLAAKRNGTKGLGIASTVISIVAIVLVFVTQAAYSAAIDEISAAVEDAADGERAVTEEVAEAAQADALALGESAVVGDYSVAVQSVQLDADELVAAANEFNEPASGQYVVAELAVEYTGTEEGDPWLDLNPELLGADARIYDEGTCLAALEQGGIDLPTLTSGGTGLYQVCFDVPEAAIGDTKLRVSETLAFTDNEGAIWATK
jgi:hypothetical protein